MIRWFHVAILLGDVRIEAISQNTDLGDWFPATGFPQTDEPLGALYLSRYLEQLWRYIRKRGNRRLRSIVDLRLLVTPWLCSPRGHIPVFGTEVSSSNDLILNRPFGLSLISSLPRPWPHINCRPLQTIGTLHLARLPGDVARNSL